MPPEQRNGLQMVNSKALDAAAAQMRKTEVPSAILKCGVKSTPAQLETAAGILRDSDPSVITSPRRLASTSERPGFIDRDQQIDPDTLTFSVGIIPSTVYRIRGDGQVVETCS